jgi:CubicO group peptidase (beta-lactamase class C family)
MPRWSVAAVAAVAACSHAPAPIPLLPPAAAAAAGRHHDDVAAQVQPFLDAELVTGIVVGLYDVGHTEVYGFGRGPNNAPPDASTLFELGPVTKVYTSLLFADAVQRREVSLDTPLAELLPPGVTAPIRDGVAITLGQIATHTAGLPRVPPSVARRAAADLYGGYNENALYNDLIRTELESRPGTHIAYSNYGGGLLGFVLGRKLGGGYPKLIVDRVLKPLDLTDTFIAVPDAAKPRRVPGTNEDLAAATPWTYDAMAGSGALISSARDQLRLLDAELDAAAGGQLVLRRAMKLTQEPQLDRTGDNEGIGWMIDSAGRFWHNGSTSGFHTFLGFDPKTKRGVVILASTATSLVDRLSEAMYKVLDGSPPSPPAFATAADVAAFAGTYELSGSRIQVIAQGRRLYLEGPGEPRHRLSPMTDHEFWIEALQSVAIFERDGDKVARLVFGVGDHTITAARVATE